MFECGVVDDSELAVVAHGSQQNGSILGNGCAIFLSKFTATMVRHYNRVCETEGVDPNGPINQKYYQYALIYLDMLGYEDCAEHGRLLLLKDILKGFT